MKLFFVIKQENVSMNLQQTLQWSDHFTLHLDLGLHQKDYLGHYPHRICLKMKVKCPSIGFTFPLYVHVAIHVFWTKICRALTYWLFVEEEGEVCTPAGFVGSLHLSNQAMLVPETTESDDPLPSTPEELVGLPRIIPSSPTDGSFQGSSKHLST